MLELSKFVDVDDTDNDILTRRKKHEIVARESLNQSAVRRLLNQYVFGDDVKSSFSKMNKMNSFYNSYCNFKNIKKSFFNFQIEKWLCRGDQKNFKRISKIMECFNTENILHKPCYVNFYVRR